MMYREYLNTFGYLKKSLLYIMDKCVGYAPDNRRTYSMMMVNEIKSYISCIDSSLKGTLSDLIYLLKNSTLTDERLGEVRGLLEALLDMKRHEMESIDMDVMNEQQSDIEFLNREVLSEVTAAREQWCIDDAQDNITRIAGAVLEHCQMFRLTQDAYLIENVLSGCICKDLSLIESSILEYARRRLIMLNMTRFQDETVESVKLLAKDIMNALYLINNYPNLSQLDRRMEIATRIDRYQARYYDNHRWYLLDAIKDVAERGDEGYQECIESDISHYRDERLQDFADQLGYELVPCKYCGELLSPAEIRNGSDGEVCCSDCFGKHFFVCVDCGETFSFKDENFHETMGDYLCNRCFDRDYMTCDDCGEIILRSESYYIDSYDVNVCEGCRNNYVVCACCDSLVAEDDARWSDDAGEWYCQDCYDERYASCHYCGAEVYREDGHYVEEIDDWVCDECYEERYQVIHSYHSGDVEFEPMLMPGEKEGEVLTIGIEHEVGGDKDYARDYIEVVNKDRTLVNLFKDGSVDGFEIVSNPMSVRFFYEVFLPKYKEGLALLERCGFEGEDEGGIHIHFNEIDNPMELARICNVLYGDSDARQAWIKITNRTEDNLSQWASMTNRMFTTADILAGVKRASSKRYTALNYDGDRTCTHEIRIFNSTIRIDTYIAYVEVTLALLAFAKIDIGRGAYVTTYDFVKYIYDNETTYPQAWILLENNDVFEDYNVMNDITPDVNLSDVQLSPQDEAEVESVVQAIFGEAIENDNNLQEANGWSL